MKNDKRKNLITIMLNGKTYEVMIESINGFPVLDKQHPFGSTSHDTIIHVHHSFWNKILLLLGWNFDLHTINSTILIRKTPEAEKAFKEMLEDNTLSELKQFPSMKIFSPLLFNPIGYQLFGDKQASFDEINDDIIIIHEVPHVCIFYTAPRLIEFFEERFNWKAFIIVSVVSLLGALSRRQDSSLWISLQIFLYVGIPLALIIAFITSDYSKSNNKFNSHD